MADKSTPKLNIRIRKRNLLPDLQKLTVRNKMFSKLSAKVHLGKGLEKNVEISPTVHAA